MNELSYRVARIQETLVQRKLHAHLVQNSINSLYLSGFPCSNSIILITRKQAFFLTDFRYIVKARKAIRHLEVLLLSQQLLTEIGELVRKLRLKRIGFEETMSHASFLALQSSLSGKADLIPAVDIVTSMRRVKSPAEISLIAKNQKLNETIFTSALTHARIGMPEIEIRKHILREMIDHDCEEAFSSIIAAGANSALPHAVPSQSRVAKNKFLLFDMGVKKNHYHSDMTRTVGVGEKLPAKAREIYSVVFEAQIAALEAIRPGVECKSVDKIARDIISAAGYGQYFGHGLGHGVGLEIHEGPTLNARSKDVLEAGMIVTVEPGIYLPELGGVRIEDIVVVTANGHRNLTSISKTLSYIL